MPSSASEKLKGHGVLNYDTAQANGCGFAKIKYHTFADDVSFAGHEAQNQTFALVIKNKPPNKQTITKFPHQGIVGMSGTTKRYGLAGGTPFFQTLCNQGKPTD